MLISQLPTTMPTKITVNRNGSLRVQGDDFVIVDVTGKEYGLGGRTTVSLCRCGASKNQPFCDGSHREIGFQHRAEAYDLPPRAE
jgi:CDGSH-type Zn-finger protein